MKTAVQVQAPTKDARPDVRIRPATLFPEVFATIVRLGDTLLDYQKQRIQVSNQISAMKRRAERDPAHAALLLAYLEPPTAAIDVLEKGEKRIQRDLERAVKLHPFAAQFVAQHKGVGLVGVGELWTVFGDLDRFPMVSSLWHYCGGQVVEGRAVKHQRGVNASKGIMSYSARARTIAYRVASAAVKGENGYRELYDITRAHVLARPRLGPSQCPLTSNGQHVKVHERYARTPVERNGQVENRKTDGSVRAEPCIRVEDGREVSGHVHAHCLRIVWKRVLQDMWSEWQDWKKASVTA